MFQVLALAHRLLFRLCLWLLRLPFKAVLAVVASILALLGEEIRRWVGIILGGGMIFLAGKATLKYAPTSKPLVLAISGLVAVWALVAIRAARFTMHNNLVRVRQRQYFRQIAGEVGGLGDRLETIRGEVVQGAARRSRGTPLEGMWQSNRQARIRERKEAEIAAERQAAAQRAKAEHEEWAATVNAEHDPYERQGS